ncbi:hypothetical protein Tco_0483603 [Tanacetum coccineum]
MQLKDDVLDFPRGGQSSLRRAEENKATTMMSHIRKDMVIGNLICNVKMASSEKEVSRGSSFHKSSNNYDVPQKQRYDNRQPYLHLQDEDTDEDDQKITRKMTKKRNKKLILYNQKNMARMSAQLHMEMSARNKKNRAANEIPTTIGTRSVARRIDIANVSLHKQVEHERKWAEASEENVEKITDILAGDGVAGIKRRRRDLYSDGVRNFATASGCGRLTEDLESSTWRWHQDF